MKKKYRIAEFKIEQPGTGNKFFVEVGIVYRQKAFWIFTEKKTNWELKDGFKTMAEALSAVDLLKLSEPSYHNIK